VAAKKRLEELKAQEGAEKASKALQISSCEQFFRETLKFGEEQLSPAQWVFVRVVFDRVDPKDLKTEEERAHARKLFGDVDEIPSNARHVVAMLKGLRVGGTWLWSLFLLYRALTADFSRLAPGEHGFGIIVGPLLSNSYQSIKYIKGAIEVAGLKAIQLNDAIESVIIKRPNDGRIAEIICQAASAGGKSGRSRSYFAALLDEAAFFRSAGDGVLNDQDIYDAIAPRVMAGGTLGLVSTVWAEAGLLWSRVKANLGAPKNALACICRTLDMREDQKIRDDYEIAVADDPEKAAREFDCVPLSSDTGAFFEGHTITAAIAKAAELGVVLGMPPPVGAIVGAGADLGIVNDSAACAVVHRQQGIYRLADLKEEKPTKSEPLKLKALGETFSKFLLAHGKTYAFADQHEFEAGKENMEPHGCTLEAVPAGQQGKFEVFTAVRELFRQGLIAIPASEEKLILQLREVMSRPVSGGGLKIWSPRKVSGHGDDADAFVRAVWDAINTGDAPTVKRSSATSRWGAQTRTRGF
jgi:hypothetical protein